MNDCNLSINFMKLKGFEEKLKGVENEVFQIPYYTVWNVFMVCGNPHREDTVIIYQFLLKRKDYTVYDHFKFVHWNILIYETKAILLSYENQTELTQQSLQNKMA